MQRVRRKARRSSPSGIILPPSRIASSTARSVQEERFSRSIVSESPAIVSIFCSACLSSAGLPAQGFVDSVVQPVAGIPEEGATWWKVGTWMSPPPPSFWSAYIDLQWKTCTSDCYSNTDPANIRRTWSDIGRNDQEDRIVPDPSRAAEEPAEIPPTQGPNTSVGSLLRKREAMLRRSRSMEFTAGKQTSRQIVHRGVRKYLTNHVVETAHPAVDKRVRSSNSRTLSHDLVLPPEKKLLSKTPQATPYSAREGMHRRKILQADDSWALSAQELVSQAVDRESWSEVSQIAPIRALLGVIHLSRGDKRLRNPF